MENYLEDQQLDSSKSMELVSNEAVKQAVIAGIGFSIMPLIGLKNELANGSLKIFPQKDLPIITNWNLIYNQRKKLSPASRELIKTINEVKGRVVEEYFQFEIL